MISYMVRGGTFLCATQRTNRGVMPETDSRVMDKAGSSANDSDLCSGSRSEDSRCLPHFVRAGVRTLPEIK